MLMPMMSGVTHHCGGASRRLLFQTKSQKERSIVLFLRSVRHFPHHRACSVRRADQVQEALFAATIGAAAWAAPSSVPLVRPYGYITPAFSAFLPVSDSSSTPPSASHCLWLILCSELPVRGQMDRTIASSGTSHDKQQAAGTNDVRRPCWRSCFYFPVRRMASTHFQHVQAVLGLIGNIPVRVEHRRGRLAPAAGQAVTSAIAGLAFSSSLPAVGSPRNPGQALLTFRRAGWACSTRPLAFDHIGVPETPSAGLRSVEGGAVVLVGEHQHPPLPRSSAADAGDPDPAANHADEAGHARHGQTELGPCIPHTLNGHQPPLIPDRDGGGNPSGHIIKHPASSANSSGDRPW